MSAPLTIASADPVIAAALLDCLRDAGFTCAENAPLVLADADHPKSVQSERILYLAKNPVSSPQPAMQKPVRRAELIAKLHQLAEMPPDYALAGGWTLCPAERLLKSAERTMELTEKEAALLVCLLSTRSRTVSRQKLLADVWGYKRDTDTHTLETHVHRLRAKLKEIGGEGWIVATEEGYKIL